MLQAFCLFKVLCGINKRRGVRTCGSQEISDGFALDGEGSV